MMQKEKDFLMGGKGRLLTKENWDCIRRYKMDFLSGKIEDPRQCPILDPAIALSWLRSKEYGVDPHIRLKDTWPHFRNLPEAPLQPIDEELIRLAKPLFEVFDSWTPLKRFDLTLDSALTNRQLLKNKGFASDSEWNISGPIQVENVLGTNAGFLAKLLGHPISVQGPEYYSWEFEDVFCAAAPIFNGGERMVGLLHLAMTGLSRMEHPWDETTQLLFAQMLGVVSSLAMAIENKLQLSLADKKIQDTNTLLETMLSLIDTGIVIIDGKGKVISSNRVAARNLHITEHPGKHSIQQYLLPDSRFMKILEKGDNLNIEETLRIDGKSQHYLIQIRSLIREGTDLGGGAVLSLQKAEQVDKLSITRTGHQARFTFEDLVGESAAFQQAVRKGQLWANLSENILLAGESGTGKEMFAQAIHNSYNRNGPFVAVNCAAIPRELIESELFGYERGSFTGADKNGRPGKIELAHHGTLFLDEIGDMPFELQAVLLRVLENKQVSRIGSVHEKQVDFRLIAATNKNLEKLVAENRFRQDLYYRLSVLSIKIPPLRKREQDALILANYFLAKDSKKLSRPVPFISEEAASLLLQYDWPGNVRQLENAVIYSIHTGVDDILEPEHLSEEIIGETVVKNSFKEGNIPGQQKVPDSHLLSLRETEKAAIKAALNQTENNMMQTARILGISTSTLYRKVKVYGISNE